MRRFALTLALIGSAIALSSADASARWYPRKSSSPSIGGFSGTNGTYTVWYYPRGSSSPRIHSQHGSYNSANSLRNSLQSLGYRPFIR